jgi:tetratricopeptide (TPR) repeat protein
MHRTKPTVSLVMIVRDEALHLADCLTPVAPLMDEIVIADTGSRDATRQIAGRFTSNVFDVPWRDDFSAARNAALRRSTGEYVFWLDADDRLTPPHLDKLAALFAQLTDHPQAFFMDTASHFQHACDGMQVHSHLRLFRRHPAIEWRGHVHEQLRPGPTRLGHEIIWTDIQIDHLGYQSPAIRQRKLRRNIRLLAMDYAVDPTDCCTLLHLGMAHAELGQYPVARQYLQQCLAGDERGLDHRRRIYHALADLSVREGKRQEALAIVAAGLQEFPCDDSLLFQQADILCVLARYADSERSLGLLLASPATRSHHGGPGEIRQKLAPRMMAEVLANQNRFQEAAMILQQLLSESPNDSRALYLLGGLCVGAQDMSSLETVCERLRDCPQGDYFAAVLESRWHLDRRQIASAQHTIDWLIAELPEAPLPRVLRCQLLALQNAPVAARVQACRDLLRLERDNAAALRELQALQDSECVVAYSAASELCSSLLCGPGLA